MQKTVIITAESIGEFQTYLQERENAKATVEKYTTDIRTFFRYMKTESGSEETAVEADKQKILSYKEWLQLNYAPSSVNSMLVALNQFLEFMGASLLKVRSLKIQQRHPMSEAQILTREEYKRLKQAAVSKKKGALMLMMEVMASTGIRVSELRYFTVKSVKRGLIEVRNKGKYRNILIPQSLQKKLLYYISKNHLEQGSVFITRNGNAQDRSNIWAQMKKLGITAEVDSKKIFPHNLRHLFAREYYQLTNDIAGLADILGHSSIETTRIYTTDSENKYRSQMERLNLVD